MELKCLPFEVKAASDDGTFEGIGNAFHTIDAAGEIVTPGAFTAALPGFLQTGFVGGLNHDWDSPIGRPLAAKENAQGLQVKAKVSDTAHGRDVLTLLRDGVIRSLSIGYQVAGKQILETPEDVAAYWEKAGYTPNSQDVMRSRFGAVLLTKINPLYEISPVSVPANELARITAVKRLVWTPEGADDKAATGSTSFPLGARDAAWDNAAADKRIRAATNAEEAPNARYRSTHFWYDAENADKFGGYKLLFCDVVDGQIRAMPRAIFACAAVMGGGRGGVDMPEADRAGVMRKIARYYARMREAFNDDTIQMPGMDTGKSITEISTLAAAEDYLRDAGSLSRKEAKAFISAVKPLLRDAASESETAEELDQEGAPQTEAEEKASETPAETEAPAPQ